MDRAVLKKINELVNLSDKLRDVLEIEGKHETQITRRVNGTCEGSLSLDWHIVEPILIDLQKKIKEDLKKLGYEENSKKKKR